MKIKKKNNQTRLVWDASFQFLSVENQELVTVQLP